MNQGPSTRDWATYDEVAEPYDRVLGMNGYALLAEHLIGLLELPRGCIVLDVGCGTGAVMCSLQATPGHDGLCVGLDPSLAMLRRAAGKGLQPLAAGVLPHLPFRSASFDGVVASLVISHVEVHDVALGDMVRVLKPLGRLGVTAWGSIRRDAHSVRLGAYALLREVATLFVSEEVLDGAFAAAVPREEWFADPVRLSEALVLAGLERVHVHRRHYTVSLRTEDYLAMMGAMALGRFMRHELGADGWRDFTARARERLLARIGERIEYAAAAHLAVGRRPAP